MSTPTQTPNVVVHDPRVRKVANVLLGASSLVVSSAVVLDVASPAFDWSAFTTPASALVLFLGGVFGLAVTTPNVPTVPARVNGAHNE